ncbi:Bug family tripartite tricarboxylate transporter substrate binding protein [Delftia acidovorans]
MLTNQTKRRFLSGATATALTFSGLGLTLSVHAQDSWPNRPIHFIVPYGPGQGTDIFARLISQELTKSLGQPIVVENKVGANGMIGADAVARAAPDGYTFMFGNASGTVMANALGYKTPYDLNRDFQPVAQIGVSGVLLVVRSDFPVSNLKDFVELIKKNPNKYQYATWGAGSSAHLVMESLKNQQNLKIGHVPYKAITQIAQDMLGGVINVGWMDATSAMAQIRAGSLKALAISGTFRVPQMPELQTMTEQGYAVGADGWYGLFAPAAVPKFIIERLNREVNAVMSAPHIKKRMYELNLANPPMKSVYEFAQTFQNDMVLWRDIVVKNGITVN